MFFKKTRLTETVFLVSALLLSQQGSSADFRLLGIKTCVATPISDSEFLAAAHCGQSFSHEQITISQGDQEFKVLRVDKDSVHDLMKITIMGSSDFYYDVGSFLQGGGETFFQEQEIETEVINTGLGKIYTHNRPTIRGESGSPIFQNGALVGIHIGTIIEGAKGIFLPINNLIDAYPFPSESGNINLQALPPAIAAAVLFCKSSGQQICGSIITSAGAITTAGIISITTYLSSINNNGNAKLQGALDQCIKDKSEIVDELGEFLEENKRSSQGNGGSSGNGGGAIEYIQVYPTRSTKIPDEYYDLIGNGSLQARCVWTTPSRMACYYPQSRLGVSSLEFLVLARIAFVSAFKEHWGRYPKHREAVKAGERLFISGDIKDVVRWSYHNSNPTNCRIGCPLEP